MNIDRYVEKGNPEPVFSNSVVAAILRQAKDDSSLVEIESGEQLVRMIRARKMGGGNESAT